MKVNWIDLLVWILPNGLEVCIFLILRLLLKRIYPRQRFGTSAPESIFNKYRGHKSQSANNCEMDPFEILFFYFSQEQAYVIPCVDF